MKFNINEFVKVKLTDHGRQQYIEWYFSLYKGNPPYSFIPMEEDENGYSKWQMWKLMQVFGANISIGCILPFETEIIIVGENG